MASAVVVKGAPMASLLKELPATPSSFEKPAACALCLLNTKGGGDDTSEKPSGKDTVDGRLALDLSVPKRFSTGTVLPHVAPSLPLVCSKLAN